MNISPNASRAGGHTHSSMSMSLHGPGVTIGATVEAGEALKDLLKALGDEMGGGVGWEIAAVYFKCDGCGLRRPDRPAADEGWTYRAGNDFCPTCSTDSPRRCTACHPLEAEAAS